MNIVTRRTTTRQVMRGGARAAGLGSIRIETPALPRASGSVPGTGSSSGDFGCACRSPSSSESLNSVNLNSDSAEQSSDLISETCQQRPRFNRVRQWVLLPNLAAGESLLAILRVLAKYHGLRRRIVCRRNTSRRKPPVGSAGSTCAIQPCTLAVRSSNVMSPST